MLTCSQSQKRFTFPDCYTRVCIPGLLYGSSHDRSHSGIAIRGFALRVRNPVTLLYMACVHPCLSRQLADLRQALLESHPDRLGEIQNRRGFGLAATAKSTRPLVGYAYRYMTKLPNYPQLARNFL